MVVLWYFTLTYHWRVDGVPRAGEVLVCRSRAPSESMLVCAATS